MRTPPHHAFELLRPAVRESILFDCRRTHPLNRVGASAASQTGCRGNLRGRNPLPGENRPWCGRGAGSASPPASDGFGWETCFLSVQVDCLQQKGPPPLSFVFGRASLMSIISRKQSSTRCFWSFDTNHTPIRYLYVTQH